MRHILTTLLLLFITTTSFSDSIFITGYDDGSVNIINWVTSSEKNSDYFIMERSENGMNWFELARIDGAGNSSVDNYYQCIDKEPFISHTYYRLIQVDFNGNSKMHNDIVVENRSTVFYTYSKEGSTTIFLSSPYPSECYNMMGQLVSRGYGDSLNINGFNQGIYMCKIGRLTRKFFIH